MIDVISPVDDTISNLPREQSGKSTTAQSVTDTPANSKNIEISAFDLNRIQCETELANKRFLQAIDSNTGTFALFDENERLIAYNKKYVEMHSFLGDALKPGLSFERCLRIQIELGMIPEAIGQEEQWLQTRIERFRNPQGPFEVEKGDGTWFRINEQRLDDGGCLKTMVDITALKRSEEAARDSEQRFKDFAETAADWFWETDTSRRFSYLSERYAALTGDDPNTVLGQDILGIYGLNTIGTTHRNRLKEAISSQQAFEGIKISYAGNFGETRVFALNGRPCFNPTGEFYGYRGSGQDITEADTLHQILEHQASHDDLTGLSNRRSFSQALEGAIENAREHAICAIIGFIDLDEFKIVNDTKGHRAGDMVLIEVAKLLNTCLDVDYDLARLGGDEFGIIIHNCNMSAGKHSIQKLLDSLEQHKFIIDGSEFDISASVGIVGITDESNSADELMRQADVACFAAKDLGRNQIHEYRDNDAALNRRQRETTTAAYITDALEHDRFTLYTQPIARLTPEGPRIEKHEVLLRLLDPSGEVISPACFIPPAERYRLMGRIDRWVIKNALANYHKVFAGSGTQIAINLSGLTLTEAGLCDYIVKHLNLNDVDPDLVCFEITETALVSDFDRAAEFVSKVNAIGCQFSLDDFGSGLSSLNYLKNFPVDYLKIDGSFITDITHNDTDRKMVAAINEMSHVLGMSTIAEFVEDEECIGLLQTLDIDFVQGYGVGRPKPMLPESRYA